MLHVKRSLHNLLLGVCVADCQPIKTSTLNLQVEKGAVPFGFTGGLTVREGSLGSAGCGRLLHLQLLNSFA